jgi:hypothetical protein
VLPRRSIGPADQRRRRSSSVILRSDLGAWRISAGSTVNVPAQEIPVVLTIADPGRRGE